MLNTGDRPHASANNLLATVAWQLGGKTTYALEGSVFVGGSVIQWLRDGLKLFSSSADSEPLAASVEDTGGVYLVPALTGLGAPYWDPYARGTIVGITRGTTSAHITRAALEAIAFEVDDVVRAMAADTGHTSTEMRVDGGAVANSLLMQFQADLTGVRIIRPSVMESTALGGSHVRRSRGGILAFDRRNLRPAQTRPHLLTRKPLRHSWNNAANAGTRPCAAAGIGSKSNDNRKKRLVMTPVLAEFIGTAVMLLLGTGVCANVSLARTKGNGAGWIVVIVTWAMAVFTRW